jgi:excisionase family DNA binding protein
MVEGKELLTAEAVATKLNITKRTVLKWAREGKIERVKISGKVVLFTAEAVDRFLQTRTVDVKSTSTERKSSGRRTPNPNPKKGGDKRVSRESWRGLREEVATWQ